MNTLARSFLALLIAIGVTLLTTDVDGIFDHTIPFDPTRMVATFVVVLVLLMALLRAMFPVRVSEDGPLDDAKSQGD
jgi:predicted tellurium resistance membrane protein TerC